MNLYQEKFRTEFLDFLYGYSLKMIFYCQKNRCHTYVFALTPAGEFDLLHHVIRGSEFACRREIEKALHCDMYFADPYCAWQKETNENPNGLLREFYPKGRSLSRTSPAMLKKSPALINAGPKKVSHFLTPQDLFQENLLKCCTSHLNIAGAQISVPGSSGASHGGSRPPYFFRS